MSREIDPWRSSFHAYVERMYMRAMILENIGIGLRGLVVSKEMMVWRSGRFGGREREDGLASQYLD